MLRLEFSDQLKEPVWLVSPNLKIGRSKNNDIILDQEGISGSHALLTVESGHVFIKDTGSAKGTYINNKRITEKIELHVHDKITLSDIDIKITEPSTDSPQEHKQSASKSKADLWSLVAQGDAKFGKTNSEIAHPLEGSMVLGRDSQCDIVINSKHISRKHCQLQIQGGVVHVKDLNSANGTFLNGKKITESYARAGDELRLQEEAFILNSPFVDQDKTILINTSSQSNNSQLNSQLKPHQKPTIKNEPVSKKPPASANKTNNTTVRLAEIKQARDALQGTSSKHHSPKKLPIFLGVTITLIALAALLFASL